MTHARARAGAIVVAALETIASSAILIVPVGNRARAALRARRRGATGLLATKALWNVPVVQAGTRSRIVSVFRRRLTVLSPRDHE